MSYILLKVEESTLPPLGVEPLLVSIGLAVYCSAMHFIDEPSPVLHHYYILLKR